MELQLFVFVALYVQKRSDSLVSAKQKSGVYSNHDSAAYVLAIYYWKYKNQITPVVYIQLFCKSHI